MTCIPATTCRLALSEATYRWPHRRTDSDGICASAAHHAQNPTSDHETGDAFDLSADPTHGVDCNILVSQLVLRRDTRIKYIIWNHRIWRSYDKPGIPAWTSAPYTGPNPHTHHMHVSIYRSARDSTQPWFNQPTSTGEFVMDQEARDKFADVRGAVAYVEKALEERTDALTARLDKLEAVVERIAAKLGA